MREYSAVSSRGRSGTIRPSTPELFASERNFSSPGEYRMLK